MAKRKNGGGNYKKVKGSNGNGDAKNKPTTPQGMSEYTSEKMMESSPLQSRAGDFLQTPLSSNITPDEAAKIAALGTATGGTLSRAATKGGLLSDPKRADDFLSSTPMRNADIIRIAGKAVSKAAGSTGSKNE